MTPRGEDDETPLGELIGFVRPVHDDGTDNDVAAARVRVMLATLSPTEERVITFRYGLYDGRQHTLQETATHVGLNPGRVRQLEQQAFGRLRQPQPGRPKHTDPSLAA